VHRKLAPNSAIARAVENLLRDDFEQRMRSREIDERVALIIGYKPGAALDE
jgi:hypothetical protein